MDIMTMNSKASILDNKMSKSEMIASSLRKNIDNGRFKHRLPTMKALAEHYDVNYKTISKAVKYLVDNGELETNRKRGTIITPSGGKRKARSTRSETKSKLVALMLNPGGHVNEVIYDSLITSLQEKNFVPMLFSADQPLSSREQIDQIVELNPYAVVVNREMKSFDFNYFASKIKKINRIIFLNRFESDLNFDADYVLSDPWSGAYQATRHLIEQGHKRIAFLTYEEKLAPEVYRFTNHYKMVQGYKMALEESGLESNSMIIAEKKSHSSEQALKERCLILKEKLLSKDAPTAIFASQDARISKKAGMFKEIGIKMPEDLAVVGYYNTPWCETSSVPMSSVSINEKKIVELTMERLSAKDGELHRHIIKPELIIRESSKNKI